MCDGSITIFYKESQTFKTRLYNLPFWLSLTKYPKPITNFIQNPHLREHQSTEEDQVTTPAKEQLLTRISEIYHG